VRRHRFGRAGEAGGVLGATGLRPILLHAEGGDGDPTGPRPQQDANGYDAILDAALHDVAGLDEDRLIAASAKNPLGKCSAP
jgi:hypothetical protein